MEAEPLPLGPGNPAANGFFMKETELLTVHSAQVLHGRMRRYVGGAAVAAAIWDGSLGSVSLYVCFMFAHPSFPRNNLIGL